MDFLSMISAAKSVSAYEKKRSWGDSLLVDYPARNMKPVVGLLLRYLISLLRAFQCLLRWHVGRYRESLFPEVNVRPGGVGDISGVPN